MSDNLNQKKPQDASRINIHEYWELAWWSEELKVSKEDLINAVKNVGTSAETVKKSVK